MLLTQRPRVFFGIAAVAAIAFGFPATALGADAGGPKIIRIDPSTGARTVLAGSSDWTALTGIAVGPTGAVYVAAQGRRAGIFSLTAPDFGIAPVATTSPISSPYRVASSGQTLYTLDAARVVSIDTSSPFTQRVVSPKGLRSPAYIAASGSTVYGTWADGCVGFAATQEAAVVAIDAATGARQDVADLAVCPEEPRGVAAGPDGTLVVVTATRVIRVNPADGSSTTISKGGLLRNAVNVAVTSAGDAIVADAISGVLRISPDGRQTTIASGGELVGVNAVALDASGSIYVTAPPVRPLKVSAAARQHFSASRGIRIGVACQPRCIVGYRLRITGAGPAISESGELVDQQGDALHVSAKRTAYLKLSPQTGRRIAKALTRHRTIKVTLSVTPETDHFDAIDDATTLTVRLVR